MTKSSVLWLIPICCKLGTVLTSHVMPWRRICALAVAKLTLTFMTATNAAEPWNRCMHKLAGKQYVLCPHDAVVVPASVVVPAAVMRPEKKGQHARYPVMTL